MTPQRRPKIQGTYSIQILNTLWDRNEQADSIPDTFCDSKVVQQFEAITV